MRHYQRMSWLGLQFIDEIIMVDRAIGRAGIYESNHLTKNRVSFLTPVFFNVVNTATSYEKDEEVEKVNGLPENTGEHITQILIPDVELLCDFPVSASFAMRRRTGAQTLESAQEHNVFGRALDVARCQHRFEKRNAALPYPFFLLLLKQ